VLPIACAAILLVPSGALAVELPQVVASWVESVKPTGARLRADIDPNDFEASYRFEYVSDADYRVDRFARAAKTKEEPVSDAGQPESQSLNFVLTPATTYHYRPVVTYSGGVILGPEHELTSKENGGTFHLLDNRGWEMVSPVDKGGGAVAAPGALFGGGDIQAALAAPEFTYGSATAFGDAAGAPPASQYVSRRTGTGWTTSNISTPLESGAYGDEPDGSPYRVFSAELSRALLFGGLACRGGPKGCPAPNPVLAGSGAPDGYMAYYLRDGSGALSSLLGAADLAHSAVAPQAFEVAFAAASPDLSHVVLSSCAKLTADATEIPSGPEQCDPDSPNLYEWSLAGLKSINGGTPGAKIAAPNGAVSNDGSRVYWTQAGKLYLRDGAEGDQVEGTQGEGGTFQATSAGGSVAFFTEGEHLYRFSVATKAAVDITPAGGVQGVLGASADAAYVYYQDAAGLERWHSGATTMLAPGAATVASDYPPATGTARVSADGLHLAFLSDAELSGFDNIDAETGQPDTVLYLYGPPAAGGVATLACASCNPTGERPGGASSIPGALANGATSVYKPRVLSAAGTRLFFDSSDALVLQDTNSNPDVYEWEYQGVGDCGRAPGCLNLISSGRNSNGGASFLDATADGSDAFFLTSESLVKVDPGSIDVYDAMTGGGIAEGSAAIDCIGDACQGLPNPPDDPTPGTLIPNSGNPRLRVLASKARKSNRNGRTPHRKGKHGKHRHRGGQGR
jgi:hypothetical protein